MTPELIIKKLALQEHIEGGYYSRTYCSSTVTLTDRTPKERPLLTSIYYLLTQSRSIGYFHRNKSDIIHYFHDGSPITYFIIHPDAQLEQVKMGKDLSQGQQLQLLVKSGCWKASFLEEGAYGLISEAVSPGFDYNDMELASADILKNSFPEMWEQIKKYVQ